MTANKTNCVIWSNLRPNCSYEGVMIETLMEGFTGSIDDYVKELGKRIKTVTKCKWFVGFRDRGLGHGDFAVMTKFKGKDILVVECSDREIADHICKVHNEASQKRKI